MFIVTSSVDTIRLLQNETANLCLLWHFCSEMQRCFLWSQRAEGSGSGWVLVQEVMWPFRPAGVNKSSLVYVQTSSVCLEEFKVHLNTNKLSRKWIFFSVCCETLIPAVFVFTCFHCHQTVRRFFFSALSSSLQLLQQKTQFTETVCLSVRGCRCAGDLSCQLELWRTHTESEQPEESLSVQRVILPALLHVSELSSCPQHVLCSALKEVGETCIGPAGVWGEQQADEDKESHSPDSVCPSVRLSICLWI